VLGLRFKFNQKAMVKRMLQKGIYCQKLVRLSSRIRSDGWYAPVVRVVGAIPNDSLERVLERRLQFVQEAGNTEEFDT
jgi:hypothetical protein